MNEFRSLRRSKQALSNDEVELILAGESCGVLAIQGIEGYPYAVPLTYVYADGKFYFHSATSGHKVEAIGNGTKASFCVVGKNELHPEKLTTYFSSVIAFGTIKPVSMAQEDELVRICQNLGTRYCAQYPEMIEKEIAQYKENMLGYVLEVEHMTGKKAIELVEAQA